METKQLVVQIEQITTLTISSPEDMTKATQALSELNTFLDGLTEEKEKLTKPLNTALKEIRERYKPTETQLEEAIKDIKSKMSAYQTKMLQAQRLAEQKIADQLASGRIKKVETAVRKIEAIEVPEQKIQTEAGGVSFRTVKKFEVVDIAKLPMIYLQANEAEIRKAMNMGVKLDGVRYFEEQSIINKRN